MKKILAKLLVFLFIVKLISPIAFIGHVFAVSNTWDFSNSSDYTLSDTNTNHIRIENSLVRLPYHLEHLGAITDSSLDGSRRVLIKGDYAYISAYNSGSIVAIDISNPKNPKIVGSIVNGDGGMKLDGPVGLANTGSYLYVAGYKSDNVNIIDISDPTNMSFVKEIADDSWKQQLNGAKDIKISGSHLYVTSYQDKAFNIFDNSDPSDPSFIQYLNDDTKLKGANRAKIDSGYAYIASNLNDSFQIIDLTNQDSQFQKVSIVGTIDDGDNGALLDGARAISFSGNLAYVSSNVSDALEIIDISDKTNPIHTGSISNGGDVKLDANRDNILYNGFDFNTARSSDAIEVVDISNPTNPVHESSIQKSSTILLNGPNDIVHSGSLFYVASSVSDALEILKAKYSDNSPYIIPNNAYNYTGSITNFSEILGVKNQGNITYQISYNNGNDWYYFDGNKWQVTNTGVVNSNSATIINTNLYSFNKLNKAGTGSFLFKAFLNSNGNQKVQLDKVNITTVESPIDISNPVFWYDGQDTDGDGDSTNEPNAGAEVSPFTDKFNAYNAYENTGGEIPTYNTGVINNHPNLNFDGNNDHYIIDNQTKINTASSYYQKSFSIVFKTSDDVNTFQNIYEQGGSQRGYNIQIENGHLYAGVFNNQEWASGDQYKFVDLGAIKTNQTYYLTMIQESTNSKTLKVYLDSNLIATLNNVDYQRSHGGSIGFGYINGNTIKASDNSVTKGPAYFKGNIGEFISWNHALTDTERQGIDMYLKNKWGLIFQIFPIITGSNISDFNLYKTSLGLKLQFYYKDGIGGTGIDTNSANLTIKRLDSGNFGNDLYSKLIDTGSVDITSSTGTYLATGSWLEGEYEADFKIANKDGNYSNKKVYFYIDPLGIPWKVLDIDLKDPKANGGIILPTSGTGLALIKDKFLGYDAYQNTSGNQAIYYNSGIINLKNPGIVFDGVDDYYNIANEYDLNTAPNYYEKSFSYIFKTGNDIDTFQNIYEQGGGVRGYAIQVQSGTLFVGAWNNKEWASGDQYKILTGSLKTNTVYNVTMVQNSNDTSNLANTTFKVYIDGTLIGTLNNIDYQRAHAGAIAVGEISGGAVRLSDDNKNPGDGHYFKGSIGEIISWNHALTNTEVLNLNEFLRKKWSLDKVAPIISSTNFASGSILPGGNHNLIFSYSDTSEYGTGVGINTASGNIILQKWDSGNSDWVDVSDKIGTGILTQTGASYPTLNLNYGKYKVSFSISDRNGNISKIFKNIFYIDQPKLIISTGSINIGKLNSSSNTFGDTLTVTVKTIGAPFVVKLKKNQELTHSNGDDFIPYYDGSIGMGYDKNNDGNLSDYNDDIILSDSGTLNTDGDLNTYTYTLKMGAIIDKLQAGGDYTGKIDFSINLDY